MDLRQIEEQSHKQSTELPVGIIRGFPDPAQGIHGAPEGLGVFFLCEKGFGLFPHLEHFTDDCGILAFFVDSLGIEREFV